MKPAISIIIPAHNEEDYLRQTLHSIKDQTYRNYEVIVVANGCTDNTEEIAAKRGAKLLSMAKPNVSRARNYGASKASGDLLLFLDADTTLEKDSLKKIKDDFTEKYSIGTTLTKADLPDFKFKLAQSFKNFYSFTKLYKGCSGALICRREDFDKVNGYDPNIIVKEHRKLVNQLLNHGEFLCVNTYTTTSMRRLKQWGISKSALFWVKQWVKDKTGNLENTNYEKIR